jgi:hypothetical protein
MQNALLLAVQLKPKLNKLTNFSIPTPIKYLEKWSAVLGTFRQLFVGNATKHKTDYRLLGYYKVVEVKINLCKRELTKKNN